jgi:hypothetical protein
VQQGLNVPENEVEAFNYPAEHNMLAVQMGCCPRRNEKLGKERGGESQI